MPDSSSRAANAGQNGGVAAIQQRPFALVAPLLRAALVLGASGGFLLAAILTLTRALQIPSGLWWVALAQAHGHLQLYGWAGFFVLGVAFHFLPRLRGAPLAMPLLVPWILGEMLGSLVLRTVSQPLLAAKGDSIWRLGLIISGLLEGLALLGVVAIFVRTAQQQPPLRTRGALWSILPFLLGVCVALGLAAFTCLLDTWQATQSGGVVPTPGDQLNVTLGLLGFLVPMALAMSARSLPMYAGLEAFPAQMLWPLASAYFAGLMLACLGLILPSAWSSRIYGLGILLLGITLIFFVAVFIRIMRTRGRLPERVARLASAPETTARAYREKVSGEARAHGPFVALIVSAYMWALLGGALLAIDGLALAATGTAPLAADGAQHSLALGFIALLICGIAPRMLPGFSGKRIASAKLVAATLWLGNGAAVLRVGSVLAAPWLATRGQLGSTVGNLAFGLSGPLGLALALCLAINLWPSLNSRATTHHGSVSAALFPLLRRPVLFTGLPRREVL
ncbi:MAG TPA: NnrS family protein [Ktedonobacterales bacterium]|jgi:uncharacterized protein involved in response to NO|nr:NnrS family protein [Ktedonobacterales bacterium]